jgi:membrane protein Man1
VRIQNVIMQKADNKGDILHMAVDRGSREGCVYIKCATTDDAGKEYHSLNGWWFDGNLVTVKYLSPERYQYRFPDSVKATFPLQPSNGKR